MTIVPNSYGVDLREFNDCHLPAGSPDGGQFCSQVGVPEGYEARYGKFGLTKGKIALFPVGSDVPAGNFHPTTADAVAAFHQSRQERAEGEKQATWIKAARDRLRAGQFSREDAIAFAGGRVVSSSRLAGLVRDLIGGTVRDARRIASRLKGSRGISRSGADLYDTAEAFEDLITRYVKKPVALTEFNPCHEPAGQPTGGQFCSGVTKAGDLPRRESIPLTNVKLVEDPNPVVIPGIGVLPPGGPMVVAQVPKGTPVIVYRGVPENTLIRTAHEGLFYSRKTWTASNEGRTQVATDPQPIAGLRGGMWSADPSVQVYPYLVQVDIQGTTVKVSPDRVSGAPGQQVASADLGLGLGVEDKLPVDRILNIWRVDPKTNALTPVSLEEFKGRTPAPSTRKSTDELAAEVKNRRPSIQDALRTHFGGAAKKSVVTRAVAVADAFREWHEPLDLQQIVNLVRETGKDFGYPAVKKSLETLIAAGIVTYIHVGLPRPRYFLTKRFGGPDR